MASCFVQRNAVAAQAPQRYGGLTRQQSSPCESCFAAVGCIVIAMFVRALAHSDHVVSVSSCLLGWGAARRHPSPHFITANNPWYGKQCYGCDGGGLNVQRPYPTAWMQLRSKEAGQWASVPICVCRNVYSLFLLCVYSSLAIGCSLGNVGNNLCCEVGL